MPKALKADRAKGRWHGEIERKRREERNCRAAPDDQVSADITGTIPNSAGPAMPSQKKGWFGGPTTPLESAAPASFPMIAWGRARLREARVSARLEFCLAEGTHIEKA